MQYLTILASAVPEISLGPQNLNGSRDLTTPLSGPVCYPQASTCYDQSIYQICNLCSTQYEDMKGDIKYISQPKVTTKSVCQALMKQFMITGVPVSIWSDNASNFTGKLTREFLLKLGCQPRFSTPSHPQAAGLCERWVGTLKSMVSKVAQDHPRQCKTMYSLFGGLRGNVHGSSMARGKRVVNFLLAIIELFFR